MAGPALSPGATRGLNCPSCGAAIELRGMTWTQTIACASCAAVLDARDPNLQVLSRFDARIKVKPLIPLGAKGTWKGALHQVIGMQQRTITVDGVAYSWREYLLFNPYRGFRYLTEYDGHWNDVVPLPGAPVVATRLAKPVATYGGRDYQHFQAARAKTTFVLGEFPWEVRAGDTVQADDYVAPPFILSSETTDDETTWSMGEYVDARELWKAFGVPGSPPSPRGVYANQPSPHRSDAASYWKLFAMFALALLVLLLLRTATARNARVFDARYTYDPARAEQAFVTPSFELPGASGNVVVETRAAVSNQWLYVEYALINERTGQAFDFSREVSYYSGVDDEGRWTEGSTSDRAKIGPVPGGRYFLRIEPQAGAQAGMAPVIDYSVAVRRDVPSPVIFLLGLLVLLVPPALGVMRAASFETQRWAESDHPMVSATASNDDDDDD
jgi:hypothetical protein